MARRGETHEWESQEVYLDWIGKYAVKKTNRKNFINFVQWIKMTPEEMIQKRKNDLKSEDLKTQRFFEDRLKEYGKFLMGQGLKSKTGEVYTSSVRAFFSYHYLNLKFRRGELKFEELPEIKAVEKTKWILNNTELRALASVANPRDKVLILVMVSTGLAPVDTAQLRIEAFRLYDENDKVVSGPVFGVKKREKTNIQQYFMISEEVLFYLKPLLRERGNPKEGNLLTTRKGNNWNTREINARLKVLAGKAFGAGKAKEFQAKNLRDYYHNCLMLGGVETGLIDYCMGWKRPEARSSYPPVESVINQAYQKARKYFSINGESQTTERVARMENMIGQQAIEINGLKETLDKVTELLWLIQEGLVDTNPDLSKYPKEWLKPE